MKVFECHVITGEKIIFRSNVTSLIAPTIDGYIGIMANHHPLITLLCEGKLTIKDYSKPDAFKVNTFNIREGVMEVQKNIVTLMVNLKA